MRETLAGDAEYCCSSHFASLSLCQCVSVCVSHRRQAKSNAISASAAAASPLTFAPCIHFLSPLLSSLPLSASKIFLSCRDVLCDSAHRLRRRGREGHERERDRARASGANTSGERKMDVGDEMRAESGESRERERGERRTRSQTPEVDDNDRQEGIARRDTHREKQCAKREARDTTTALCLTIFRRLLLSSCFCVRSSAGLSLSLSLFHPLSSLSSGSGVRSLSLSR